MNILVTGACGFVGTNLSNYLKDNHTLWALDILEKPTTAYSNYYSWNDLDTLPWDEVNTIIHLAGKAHDTKPRGRQCGDAMHCVSTEYFAINTGLTRTIFDYFLQSKATQFIFFSSVKAVADTIEGDFLTEDVVPKPIGPYGESKIKAEEYILSKEQRIAGQARNDNKRVYILRPCMIHGQGNKGNLNLLYNIVSKGIPWPLGAFDNKRSFLSIDNLSYIVEQFILQNPESGIYHLADDEPVSTNELIKLIAESKGKKAKLWNCNKRFIKTLARIGDVCKLPLNSDRLQKLTENYVVSNQKVKQTLGTTKLPVTSVTGLKRTLATF